MSNGIVIACLKQHGPCLARDLGRHLVSKSGMPSSSAASKAIRRARDAKVIESTEPVRFGHDYLYFLKEHRPAQYAKAVRRSLKDAPMLYRVYKCILANRGYITEGQIVKAAACVPDGVKAFKTKRPFARRVIDSLKSLGLIEEMAAIHRGFVVGKTFRGKVISYANFKRAIDLDHSVFEVFVEWLKHCLMLSWEGHNRRPSPTEAVAFNRTAWDVTGPSMFGPFTRSDDVRKAPTKSAFIMGETLSYRQYSISDAESTIERLKSVALTNSVTSFFPVVLARGYSLLAMGMLKSRGIIPLTLKDVFGGRGEELLRIYSDLISNLSPPTIDGVERSLALADIAELDEGFMANIRGDLFEMIISLAMRGQGYDTALQKPVSLGTTGKKYEIDIVAIKSQRECLLIECKGRRKDVVDDPDEIVRHFKERCGAAADEFGWDVTEKYPGNVTAIYITSGVFDEACSRVIEGNKRSHGITCVAIDRNNLGEFLDRSGEPRLSKLVDRYFS